MASDSTNAFSALKWPVPNPRVRHAPLFLPTRRCVVVAWMLFVMCSGVLHGADSYSTALDKRFATETATETPQPAVASFERGLKEQVRRMSQLPESAPPVSGGSKAIEVCFLWVLGVVGAFSLGIITVLVLRRWPEAKPGSAEGIMAEDPVLAEFLRTFRESVDVAPLTGQPAAAEPLGSGAAPDPPAQKPPVEGFDALCRHLPGLRAVLSRLELATDDGQRMSLLRGLLHDVELMKEHSGSPELRSIWLVACALQGLLKRLSSKAANLTPSALRTVASAIDSLELLCTRSVRPDLATHPPVRLLAVDDDPISRRAISVALKNAFDETEVAADGQSALALTQRHAYDLIFLDVEMPGLDGFEVCSKIHETALNRTTPVVFVTNHTDFEARAKSAAVGAHELIGKPFLAFEITVKALTLVLRTRAFTEAANSPAHAPVAEPVASTSVQSVASPISPLDHTLPNARRVKATRGEVSTEAASQASSPPRSEPDGRRAAVAPPSSREFARAFFHGAPAHVRVLLNKLASIRESSRSVDRDEVLGELFIGAHAICSEAGHAHLDAAFRVSSALEAMLKKMIERPALCTPSTLQTATFALECMEQLCVLREDLDLTDPGAWLLVVDDDPIARRAIGGALQLAFGRPDNADCGEAAVALADEKAYDLIFLDVIMPGMDGFTACTRLHDSDLNRRTPVVFVTSHDDATVRAQAAAAGGCGFIPKPVLPCEITVLALTSIVHGRLERRTREPWESAERLPARESVLAS